MAVKSEMLGQAFALGLTAYAGVDLLFALAFVSWEVQRVPTHLQGRTERKVYPDAISVVRDACRSIQAEWFEGP
jgi:hypothetical protein